jgi:signal transduction histidine kinase
VRQIQSRNRELASQVADRTAELRHKNEQLEKSQAIIEAINAETGLQPLLNAVLEQTRVIPGVEKASALIYDEGLAAFVFKASLGWDLLQIGPIEVSGDDAHARYVEHAEEIAEDIFLERDVADRPGSELLRGLETPASLLVMRISSGDQVEGYLVFDNMHRRDAFDRQDLELLISLKEHIRSAFVKTRLLENLRRSLDHLKTTQAQLVQSEKLASLGQLTAGIAHEIKNPLNFINNFAALCAELADEVEDEIRSRGAADENIEAILSDLRLNAEKIQEHGRRADGIVKSMLEHSRGKSGERRETDLNALLDEYVSLAYHGMRAQETQFNCRIERSFDGSIGHLDLVPQDLGRVFINILNNAFYAVYEKSKTCGEVYEPAVAVSTVRFNGSVEIRINDNGPGVPETLRKKIFEPFYTTKPTGSGTGLGLSLSHDIVTQVHGGEMYVESIEGEQTTFVINIPVGAENGQFATEN